MLRPLLCLLPLLLSLSVKAQPLPPSLPPIPLPPVSGRLDATFSRGIVLPEFVRIVLEDTLRVPFVLAPELVTSTDTVAVSLKGLSRTQALSILEEVLKSRGFSVKSGSVYIVTKLPPPSEAKPKGDPEPREVLTYRPRYRSIQTFQEQLPGLFPTVYFSFSRRQSSSSDSTSPVTSTDKREPDLSPVDVFFADAPKSVLASLTSVLSALDAPVSQVRIKASLYEVGTSSATGNGVSLALSVLNDKLKLSFGDAQASSSAPYISFKTPAVSAVFTALDGDSRFKSLSSPELLVASGKEASLQVGSSVPILSSTTTTDNGTSQSVEYRDTGTILRIKPEVRDSSILLDVSFELSDAVQTTTGVLSSPTLVKREFKSSPVLSPGEFLIVGGLTSDRTSQASSRSFFSFSDSDSRNSSRSELVLVLYADKP